MSEERKVVQLPDYLDADGVLTCPGCGCQEFRVVNSYQWSDGKKRRRRVCSHCQLPITTIETVDFEG